MTETFVDSSFWIALLNPRDAMHGMAARCACPPKLVTTTAIILEVMGAFSSRKYRPIAVEFRKSHDVDPTLAIVPLRNELLELSLKLFHARTDKDWSFTDCISFVTMQERGINDALTADHHFEQAGFQILLR